MAFWRFFCSIPYTNWASLALWAVHFPTWLGSGVALLAFPVFPLVFPAFPGVNWRWRSIIGCVSLSVPSIFCSVLVGIPSWLTMFVVPACWLACFAAAVSRCLQLACIPMCVACFCIWAFGGCCFSCVFLRPLPPPFPFFSFVFLLFHWLIQCDWCSGVLAWGGGGFVARVQVGKATGVVYLPWLGFMCSPGG